MTPLDHLLKSMREPDVWASRIDDAETREPLLVALAHLYHTRRIGGPNIAIADIDDMEQEMAELKNALGLG